MLNRKARRITRNIALTGGLVLLFAGCQMSAPTTQPKPEQNVNPGGTTHVASQANASVAGTVTDPNGKPIAGVEVNTYGGFRTTTDAQGHYTIPAVAQNSLRLDYSKDGFIVHQAVMDLTAGQTGNISTTLQPEDAKVTHITAATGGTAVSSDGSSILDIPPGALSQDSDVRLTWLDPMPSTKFSASYGQLPGPLTTQTQEDGNAAPNVVPLSPLGFSTIDMTNELKPGATATLKMKVDPAALAQLQGQINFNDPATLQQPCYEYDRATGLWVTPSTSTLEKDSDGTVWFVYTLHGQQAPANYKALSTGSSGSTITWDAQATKVDHVQHVGGSTITYYDYYGQVKEGVNGVDNKVGGDVSGGTIPFLANNGDAWPGIDISTGFDDYFIPAPPPGASQTPPTINPNGLYAGAQFRQNTLTGVTDSNGNFGFTAAGQQTRSGQANNDKPPVVTARYKQLLEANANTAPYHILMNSDAFETLTLKGTFGPDEVGKQATLVYTIDGASFTKKNVTLDASGQIKLVFARDKQHDVVQFTLQSLTTPDQVSTNKPSTSLYPGANGQADVTMAFQNGAAKYRF